MGSWEWWRKEFGPLGFVEVLLTWPINIMSYEQRVGAHTSNNSENLDFVRAHLPDGASSNVFLRLGECRTSAETACTHLSPRFQLIRLPFSTKIHDLHTKGNREYTK